MTIPLWGWALLAGFLVIWYLLEKHVEENDTPTSRKIDRWMLRFAIVFALIVLYLGYVTISIG